VILKRMNRNETPSDLNNLFMEIRKIIPDIALRTSVLVGFPGETARRFLALTRFIRKIRFMHLGCFVFSAQTETPAFSMKQQVPKKTRLHRAAQIIKAQQEILEEIQSDFLGTTHEVLIEEFIDSGNYNYIGRAFFQAPEIDGTFFVRGTNLECGKFYNVKIEDFEQYDLFGAVTE